MQKDIIVERRDKMPTINHFSCYSINSLGYVRMGRRDEEQERDRERERKREWEQRNPVIFPLSFIPTINLDGHLDALADLAEKFVTLNEGELLCTFRFLIRTNRATCRRKTATSEMHLRKYTNDLVAPLVTHLLHL